jgi:aquaporin NIP
VGRDLRPEAAEALGTFFLLLVGGTALLSGQPAWLVAAAFGGVILVLVYALGPLSGAHFNPAITVAFAVTRHFPWRRVASYVAAQLAGAVLAVLLLRAWRPVEAVVAAGPLVGLAGFVVEACATFLLAFVIVAVATDRRVPPATTGLAIGGTVFLGSLVAGPLTGAAMNPARALAPALVAGDVAHLLLHVAGPFLGGVLGMASYQTLRRGMRPLPRAEVQA